MKIDTYNFPQSSFLGMPKDSAQIISKIMDNQTVLKLLQYNGKNWDKQPNVTEEQKIAMIDEQQVSIVPRIQIDKDFKTYIRLSYGSTIPNMSNPEYRDNTIGIDIICHLDYWSIGNFELRPYRIAGEIDSMLDQQRFSGIGLLNFVSCQPAVYNREFAGVTLTYFAVRGHEDEINPIVKRS